MKPYKKILEKYKNQNFGFIEHEWGQNNFSVYNQVVKVWPSINVGEKIFILSNKKFGLKSTLKFLKEKGVIGEIVGKGNGDVRLIEIEKIENKKLKPVERKNSIEFVFNKKTYKVDVGDSVFSKEKLDKGTEFLLSVVMSRKIDLNNKHVGDLGCGWGALSIVLAKEFSEIKITAFEKDPVSFDVAKNNLKKYSNVEVVEKDLIGEDEVEFKKYRNKFDYIVMNPPFHIKEDERLLFFELTKKFLKKKGVVFFVVEGAFVERFKKTASDLFKILKENKKERYAVFECKKI